MELVSCITSTITAFAAVVAIIISCRQMIQSNKQSLFDRRLELCVLVKGLMDLYEGGRSILKKRSNSPVTGIDFSFYLLTNNTQLHDASAIAKKLDDQQAKIAFLSMIENLKRSSYAMGKVFKESETAQLSGYIDAYQNLLFTMYQYMIILKHMEECSQQFHWAIEKASESVGEPELRDKLYTAIDGLEQAFGVVEKNDALAKVEKQLVLA